MKFKKILRKKFLSLRGKSKDLSLCLDNETIVKNTQKVIDSLLLSENKASKNVDFLDKNKSIGLYLRMRGEVDLIKLAIKFSARVALPKIKGTKMYYVKYDLSSRMEKSEFSKLMQPQNENKIEPAIIVIPALSLSLSGDRLGFGGGYYDKYINKKAQKKKIIKIGVCFHKDLSEYLPREPHDLLLDYVITDKIIIKL
jgi:5-formyltetrahydrofolate cyclo-ligase